ncbi:unnamed protein product [Strongylus vulgaris]|uniref:G-protein coupled receptors family 1 profile domain-containing protein n=1 Tax=Strongylus vulgaris TaxID=40348 RepID=A0A3P7JEP2_STRVU|nr:unnamed protein product [Strongylus vulgaris]
MSIPIIPVYIANLIIRSRIVQYLNRVTYMSHQTKSLHRSLLKVLSYQASFPLLNLLAFIAGFLSTINITNHTLIEFAPNFMLLCISILTPLISLFYVRPYFEWILLRIPTRNRVHSK